MSEQKRILLVENDPDYQNAVKTWLEINDYQVFVASSISEAISILGSTLIHLVVTDLRVTDDDDAWDISGLTFVRSVAPTVPKIILTGYPTSSAIRQALRPSKDNNLPPAIDFLSKDEGVESIKDAIDQAFQKYIRLDVPQFKVGGALTAKDAFVYAERQAEREILGHLQQMNYVIIIEPRQQGKTSFINFLIRHPKLNNTIIVYVDVTTPDRSTEAKWYHTVCSRILSQLDSLSPNTQWPQYPSNSAEWRYFLFKLAEFAKRNDKYLVFALDEIGAVTFPNATGFFSVLRDIYNSRQAEPEFHHVTFLLVGSFHPRDLITDDRISPFNIAHRVRLHDFTMPQTRKLVESMMWIAEKTTAITERIYYWTHGQPYLTQMLCSYLALDSTVEDVDKCVERLQREDENHLPSLLRRIGKSEQVRTCFKRILSGEKIPYYPSTVLEQAQLELLGVISADSNGYCRIRNPIYERFFSIAETLADISNLTSHKSVLSNIYTDKQPTIQEIHSMLTPEKQFAIYILKEAFSFVAGELKQRWKTAREGSQETTPSQGEPKKPGVSESLQIILKNQVENWQNVSQLKMVIDNLQTAIKMAEQYNKRCNKYRQQLPVTIDPVAIEMQIEEAEANRDKAVAEIQSILGRIANEEIVTEK